MAVAVRHHENSPRASNSFTLQQSYSLQIVAVTTASTSLVLGVIAFYWFLRIKRNFRHHLIVLLVAANMIKALGYLIYPLIEIMQNSTLLSRPICLANGFSLSWGIEAADFVILLIALHTALTVFRPRTTAERTGLYPFRVISYIGLAAFPTLMASLAFVDVAFPYTSNGSFCYLPIRPVWYRLALSWVPRYLILVTIIVVYLAVYMYAKYKFDEFEEKVSGDNSSAPTTQQEAADVHTPTDDPRLHTDATSRPLKSARLIRNQSSKDTSVASVYLRHKNIKHQLRLMLIYPMVYFLLSVPPFVNHCWLYTKDSTAPHALTTIAVACLAGQGAADCVIFLTREKPWQLVRLQSDPWTRDNAFRRKTVRSDDIERAQDRTGMKTEGKEGSDEPREWWDRELYTLGDAVSEGSRARSSV